MRFHTPGKNRSLPALADACKEALVAYRQALEMDVEGPLHTSVFLGGIG